MLGTLINTGAVIVGGAAGLLFRSKMPENISSIVFQALGLITLGIGVDALLQTTNMLLVVISLVTGALLGQWIGLDNYLERFSRWLQSKSAATNSDAPLNDQANQERSRFSEGFITATMIFCVGSMSILGSIEDGMGSFPTILLTKSVMDGVCAMVLAFSFGLGVLFSAFPLFIYQGGLTLLTLFVSRYMSESMMADVTGTGGLMLIGLGLSILKIKKINVVNMLPALVIVLVLSSFFG